jgi:perosamine synthetase
MYSVLVPFVSHRDDVIEQMLQAGVETRPFFIPLTDLPPYETPSFPVTSGVAYRGINLPTYGGLQEKDVEYIVSSLLEAV